MKKIFVLFIFSFIATMQADPISDAIQKSDVENVRLLLSTHKPTALQLVKYLDTAEQVIKSRRDELNPKVYISAQNGSGATGYWALATLVCMGGFLGSIGRAYHFGENGRIFNTYSNHIDRWGTGFLISWAGLICSDAMDRRNHHTSALAIKEMLYDISGDLIPQLST